MPTLKEALPEQPTLRLKEDGACRRPRSHLSEAFLQETIVDHLHGVAVDRLGLIWPKVGLTRNPIDRTRNDLVELHNLKLHYSTLLDPKWTSAPLHLLIKEEEVEILPLSMNDLAAP